MKWLILFLWLSSILFIHLRGVIRFPLKRQLTHQSSGLAPINALLILMSNVPKTPYVPVNRLPGLALLSNNWQIIRDEALESQQAKTTQPIDVTPSLDNSNTSESVESDSQPFYLKSETTQEPSGEAPYPKTAALLKQIIDVEAARFVTLPAGATCKPNRHADGQFLQYHLGLSTPNATDCYTDVDGLRHIWHDGEGILLDQTYIHESHNNTNQPRLVLVCDVQRPLHSPFAQKIVHKGDQLWRSAQRQLTAMAGQTGLAKWLSEGRQFTEQKRQAFETANPGLYKAMTVGLVILAILLFLAL